MASLVVGTNDLGELLDRLARRGCVPGLYRHGNAWRVHVNRSGNFWRDDKNPVLALKRAIRAWEVAGCPLDGEASSG